MNHHLRALCVLGTLITPGAAAHALLLPVGTAAEPTTQTGAIRGQVTDPGGAVIPNATVSVTDAQGHTVSSAQSGPDGSFSIPSVTPGVYVVLITANGFGSFTLNHVTISPSTTRQLNVKLTIEVQQQNVEVNAGAPTVSVDPDANASATVIKGADLDALSDDPDELSNELTALAGPAAGPSGGQIYIDGFTAGELPPKSAILEIRINQNPYGAQYDKLGFGRIEIITKPGTDKFHGSFQAQGNARQFNTGNPFAKDLPDYDSYQYEGTASGPINKNASFFVSAQHRTIQDDSPIDTYRLAGEVNGDFANGIYNTAGDYDSAEYSDAVFTPQSRNNASARVDFQLGQKNTLSLRYQYYGNTEDNQGIGQNTLASQAYNEKSTESTIQLHHLFIWGPRVISETNFQMLIDHTNQTPASTLPTVQVSGAEAFGGSADGTETDHTLHYEVDHLTTMSLGTHSLSIGGRLRATRDANSSNGSFNGLFTFGSQTATSTNALTAYAITLQGQQNGESFSQIQAAGGGPSQLVYVTGSPKIADTLVDGALFYQDDWKVKPNFTFSYGLRWETQDDIHDHSDWAPRLSLAYGLMRHGKPTKDVIRAGFGYFYDRFALAQVLQADRVNGVVQKESVIEDPTCYYPDGLPDAATLSANCSGSGSSGTSASLAPAVYTINPNLKAAANIQDSVGLDHQLTKTSTVSVTYVHSHGVHAYDTINANAPYAPSYSATAGNVYQYLSEGVYNENQLFVNFHTNINNSLSLFGFYGLSYADGDTDGVTSNPSNSYDLKADYGPTQFSVRNRLFMAGTYSAPGYWRFSPFIVAQSGTPFNITLPQDVNGDSFFNDRPSLATAGTAGAIQTPYGLLNPNPATGATPIAYDAGTGPSLFTFNLRVSKTWGFGARLVTVSHHRGEKGQQNGQQQQGNQHDDHNGPPPGGPPPSGGGGGGGGSHGGGGGGGGGGHGGGPGGGGPFGNDGNTGRRYNLTINAQALNLFNIVNYAAPNGVLGSNLFDRSNALAGQIFSSDSASRRIFLQARLTF